MIRERIVAELPAAVAAWLADAGPELWDEVGREVAVRLGRQLLENGGEGWNRPWRTAFLARCMSPALRAIVPTLPVRAWGCLTVSLPLAAHFGMPGATDDVRRRLGESAQIQIARAA
jgi:hypothetical protein